MKYEDPPHHRSLKEPCYACEATWHTDGIGFTMDHEEDCAYLEAMEYGGTKEVR